MIAEVVVVGGGPAGLHAALAAAAAGARVWLLDERVRLGGPGAGPLPAPVQQSLRRARVRVWTGAEAWGVFPERVVTVYRDGRAVRLEAGALVLATGAHERPVAFPGWTLPGVVTAGAATALVEVQGVLPGRRVLLAGTGPRLGTAAAALVRGGAEVVGIAEAGARATLAAGAGPGVLATLRRAGVAIWPRHGIVRAEGAECVERAVVGRLDGAWRPVTGTHRPVAVDTVVIGYGLVPATELAQLAGCDVAYHAGRGGFVPVSAPERYMATSAAGVFVAGDGAGVAGAAVAAAEGRLAGIGAARFVGRLADRAAAARARGPLRRLAALAPTRRALERLHTPRPGVAEWLTDETVVCRCEEVLAAEVRAAIAEGARHVVDVRAATRCGMGLCQGRLCVATVAALLARDAGVSAEAAGRLTARPPVRPIPVEALADEALAPAETR